MVKYESCSTSVMVSTRGSVAVKRGVVPSKSEGRENKDERDEIGGKHCYGWTWKEVGVDMGRGVLKERGGKECKSLCNR